MLVNGKALLDDVNARLAITPTYPTMPNNAKTGSRKIKARFKINFNNFMPFAIITYSIIQLIYIAVIN
jgi:hypothetical protein